MRLLKPLLLVTVTFLPMAFSLFPERFDLELSVNEVYQDQIKISNLSDNFLTINIDVKNFSAKGEKGEIVFKENEKHFDFSQWIKFEEKRFVLKPRETKKLNFTIKIPEDVESGGYYGVAFFQAETLTQQETSAKILPTIGVLFLIKVKGEKKHLLSEKQIELTDFYFPKFVEKWPIPISFRVKNNDLFHVRVGGKLIILNHFGKIKEEIEIKDQTILPQKTRLFELKTKSNFFLGPYQMILNLSTQDWREKFNNQNQIVKKFNFFAFPLKPFLIILSIFLLIFFLKKLKKKYEKLFH